MVDGETGGIFATVDYDRLLRWRRFISTLKWGTVHRYRVKPTVQWL